jgi:hypothetical protein
MDQIARVRMRDGTVPLGTRPFANRAQRSRAGLTNPAPSGLIEAAGINHEERRLLTSVTAVTTEMAIRHLVPFG